MKKMSALLVVLLLGSGVSYAGDPEWVAACVKWQSSASEKGDSTAQERKNFCVCYDNNTDDGAGPPNEYVKTKAGKLAAQKCAAQVGWGPDEFK